MVEAKDVEKEKTRAAEVAMAAKAAGEAAAAEVREALAKEEAARAAGAAAAAARQNKPTFYIKIQSNAPAKKAAELLLTWLLVHALVVLDPGLRWVMSGIVAVLTDYKLEEQADGTTTAGLLCFG